jgi:hypothetical protein
VPASISQINLFLQDELRKRAQEEVRAVDAAGWLDAAGLLKDSRHRPGLPLRNLLRAGQIEGAEQRPPRPHGRWFIRRSEAWPEPGRPLISTPSAAAAVGVMVGPPTEEFQNARARRDRAARQYKPKKVDLLLIAEAPPSALDRYFYFDDVREQDSLFRHVCRALLAREPTREGKADLLAGLRDRAVFLIDLQEEPRDSTPLRGFVPSLINRCRSLDPEWIVLIKATVFDAAYAGLVNAGLPVSSVRVPFPGSGQQRRFLEAFERALGERPTE